LQLKTITVPEQSYSHFIATAAAYIITFLSSNSFVLDELQQFTAERMASFFVFEMDTCIIYIVLLLGI
jgi:hypothetical protein